MNYGDLHYLLLLAFNRSNKAIVHQTAKGDLLPGQPKILEFLWEHPDCTQKEISLGCVLDKSTVTSLVTRMEQQNYLTKVPDPSDRRNYRLSLTEKGKEKALEVRKICAYVDKIAWQDIPPEEQKQFLKTFQKILLNLETLEEKKKKNSFSATSGLYWAFSSTPSVSFSSPKPVWELPPFPVCLMF